MRKSRDVNDDAGLQAPGRVRLDQWLWAARFFKTRTLAAAGVAGGKVELNGQHAKRSASVRAGDELRIRLGPFEHIIVVRGLAARRGPASEAALLYEETTTSREARERLAWQLKHAPAGFSFEEKGRPTKRDRRRMEEARRKP
ncbi:MAG TPA: RNA-binding S4 domain-containing protein [Gemmatimonadales bacterium]|jgi:ribosome-associated heat shock protein Hsp15|nr:RNA-binding S4 domain-containing protein [Gemmatimonadales bacterium]